MSPCSLIDDEADNASINIRHGAGEVSRINGQVRELLQLFERSCYVGYTATPFANIFIDPASDDEMLGEDLFPGSFILSLDPPSNYFGANAVFLQDSALYIRHIDDNEDHLPIRHPKDIVVSSLPPSLIYAVRAFILGRAVRLARGQIREHCSMLVNASRFVNVQSQLRNEIHARLSDIQRSIRVSGALPEEDALLNEEIRALRHVWMREFDHIEFSWAEVQEHLHSAASPVRVVEVNSRSSGTLDYSGHRQDGLNVIAVGGFSLSRGLTLEGLMVSYFMRNSMMYDTLMQMGRWFGYRPHYQDLCRIWMTEEAQGWYEHVAESIEELRGELRSMAASNATPEKFGLKVRSHPDSLIVTARNKMGSGERLVVRISLASKLIETHTLRRDGESLDHNREAARRLARALDRVGFPIATAEPVKFGKLLSRVPVDPILGFLRRFRNHEGSLVTDSDPVMRYIEERRADELSRWDVLFVSLGSETKVVDASLGIEIRCQTRTAGHRSDARMLRLGNRHRVSSRGIEETGLTDRERDLAEREYRADKDRDGSSTWGRRNNYPDLVYRKRRERPLLMIHLIEIETGGRGDPPANPVVAWGISFPPTDREETRVEYVVNTTWMREHFGEDIEEDEMDGDSD